MGALGARNEGILKGRRVAVDSTTLQANASMKKSLVRRCDGSSYQKYLKKLAKAEGIEEPTKEDLQRLDRGRKGKKLSNKGWKSSTDGQARIAKMKDGTTRLAYNAEDAVDLQSGVIVAAEVHGADQGDTATMPKTLVEADEAVTKAGIRGGITDVIGDRGYHADAVVDRLQTLGYRTCIAERPQTRNWKAMARRVGHETMRRLRRAYRRNRRRLRSAAGRQLQKLRAEYPEGSFAHLCVTGGLRCIFVRGRKNVQKRLQLQRRCAAANLGIVMRRRALYGILLRGTGKKLSVGFRTVFSTTEAWFGDRVYVGQHCSLGHVRIQEETMIADHVVIPSGSQQPGTGRLDVPMWLEPGEPRTVSTGRGCWVGSGMVVLAD